MPLDQIAFDFEEVPVSKEPEVKNIVINEPGIIKKKKDNRKLTRGRMSLKDMDAGLDLIEVPNDELLFQKTSRF